MEGECVFTPSPPPSLFCIVLLRPPLRNMASNRKSPPSLSKYTRSRMGLFNSSLSEILFKQRVEMMDVEELIARVNAIDSDTPNERPFTLLEIKPYLKDLHDSGRIFMVEDEGRNGVVYTI
jgi:hypothetical protein